MGLYPRLRGDSGECFPLWPDQSDVMLSRKPQARKHAAGENLLWEVLVALLSLLHGSHRWWG